MINKLILAIALVFFSCASDLMAQVPGYLGKRFSFSINNSFSWPTLSAETNLDKNGEEFGWFMEAFERSVGLSANYCLSRKTVLTVGLQQVGSYSRSGYYQEVVPRNSFIKYQSRMLGIGVKLFDYKSRGFIAPLGRYFAFRVIAGNHRTDFLGSFQSGALVLLDEIEKEVESRLFLAFDLGIGMQTIVSDSIFLGYRVNFGGSPTRLFKALQNEGDHQRIDGFLLFNATIEVGGLLF